MFTDYSVESLMTYLISLADDYRDKVKLAFSFAEADPCVRPG